MTTNFLRSTLLLSFLAALSLTGGAVLYRHLNPAGLIELPSPSLSNLDLTGAPAPEIYLTDLSGNPVVLSKLRGRTVLINFWATWCPPCVKEMPMLSELYERKRARGLSIIGVAIDEIAPVKRFAQEHSINYPVVQATFKLMEQFGSLQGTMPYTVIINKDGRIAGQYFTPLDRERLDMILAAHLGDPGSTEVAGADAVAGVDEMAGPTSAPDADQNPEPANPEPATEPTILER